jgi:hypothetical protein
MLDTWNRPDYRDLAEECRRLAASTPADQMKKRYLLRAKDYTLLADIEKQERARHGCFQWRSVGCEESATDPSPLT